MRTIHSTADIFRATFLLDTLRRPCTWLLFSALSAVSALSFADESATLKATTTDTNYPYNFSKDGVLQGLSVEVVNELAARLHARLDIEVLPWTRALHNAKTQAAVMVFSLARIPDREDHYYWIGPVTSREEWLYKLRQRSDIQIRELSDARRYLVGDIANNASIPKLTKLGIKVDTAPSMLSNCRKFKIGRVELIPLAPEVVSRFAQACDLAVEDVEKVVRLPWETQMYLGFGKSTSPELIKKVEKTFESMVKDDTVHKINAKWLLVAPTEKK